MSGVHNCPAHASSEVQGSWSAVFIPSHSGLTSQTPSIDFFPIQVGQIFLVVLVLVMMDLLGLVETGISHVLVNNYRNEHKKVVFTLLPQAPEAA